MFFKTISYFTNVDIPVNVVRMSPQPDVELHWHEFSEMVIVTAGAGKYLTEHGSHQLQSGDIMIIHEKSCHGYADTNDLHIINLIYFPAKLPLPILDLYNSPGFNLIWGGNLSHKKYLSQPLLTISNKLLKQVIELIYKIEKEKNHIKIGSRFACLTFFMELILLLSRNYVSTATQRLDNSLEKVNRVIEFINSHYAEAITCEQLATVACMSSRSLARHFHAATGTSVMNYLLEKRIFYAAELLRSSTLDISEIAYAVGFQDSNYFSRQFKRITQESPKKYRDYMQRK